MVNFWLKIKIPSALDIKKLGKPSKKGRERIKKWNFAQNWRVNKCWPCWSSDQPVDDWSTGSSGLGTYIVFLHLLWRTFRWMKRRCRRLWRRFNAGSGDGGIIWWHFAVGGKPPASFEDSSNTADDVTAGDGNLAPLTASTGSPWVLGWLASFAFWTSMP